MRPTAWMIAGWTCGLAFVAAATLINPDLRYLDIIAGAIGFAWLWLVGVAPLVVLWIVACVREYIRRQRPSKPI